MANVRIGINGFGRIGRGVLRVLAGGYTDEAEVVAVNDLVDAEQIAATLRRDSTYGRFPTEVSRLGLGRPFRPNRGGVSLWQDPWVPTRSDFCLARLRNTPMLPASI